MSKKIYGNPVVTPISPSTIKKAIKPVTSVNGIEADKNGNVEVKVTDDKIAAAVAAYIAENPIEGGDGNALYYSDETNVSGIAVVTIQKGEVEDKWPGLSGTPHVGDLVISATGQLFKVSAVNEDSMYMGYIMDLKTALPENIVLSVNGVAPDENGNVKIPVSGGNADQSGLSTTAANLLIEILESAMYSTNVSGKIASLKEALASGGSGGGETPDEPDEPVVDEITVSDGVMTIVTVGSAITVSDGAMTIA